MNGNKVSLYTEVDRILEQYEYESNYLIQVLLDIQKMNRWLPEDVLLYVSEKLEVPLPQVYQIATFYKGFSLNRRGEHTIAVCQGTACHVRGASPLLEKVTQKLQIAPGKTTEDNCFSLLTVNCMGCCALGPVLAVDDTYYSNPSAAEFAKILKKYS